MEENQQLPRLLDPARAVRFRSAVGAEQGHDTRLPVAGYSLEHAPCGQPPVHLALGERHYEGPAPMAVMPPHGEPAHRFFANAPRDQAAGHIFRATPSRRVVSLEARRHVDFRLWPGASGTMLPLHVTEDR